MRVKTSMGLEPFEVRFFFSGDKFSKTDLALSEFIKNRPKVGKEESMVFSSLSLKDFFLSKVLWEQHSIEKKKYTRKHVFGPRKLSKSKSFFLSIKDLSI